MRPVLLGCLAIALTAAEAMPTPAPQAPLAPAVTFVPMRCDLRSDLRFDAAGKPKREHGVLAITLRAELPAGLTVDGWGATTLTRVQTESGETLAALPITGGESALALPLAARARLNLIHRREAMGGDQTPVAALPLTVRLVPPLRPSFTLARLEGSVELIWRQGGARSVRLTPLAAPDAPIAIDGVPAGTITIRTRSEREIGVTWSDALAVRLQQVRFEDADGGELRHRGRGTTATTRSGGTECTYQVALPEGGALVIEVLPESVTSLIPLLLEGVPLAGTGAAPLVSAPLPEPGQGQE